MCAVLSKELDDFTLRWLLVSQNNHEEYAAILGRYVTCTAELRSDSGTTPLIARSTPKTLPAACSFHNAGRISSFDRKSRFESVYLRELR